MINISRIKGFENQIEGVNGVKSLFLTGQLIKLFVKSKQADREFINPKDRIPRTSPWVSTVFLYHINQILLKLAE